MKCHKCGKTPAETGINLTRVNEKGMRGVWECWPGCGIPIPQEVALLSLIQTTSPEQEFGDWPVSDIAEDDDEC